VKKYLRPSIICISVFSIFALFLAIIIFQTGAQVFPPVPPPDCGGPTIGLTEGPFYKSNSPERKSLIEPGVIGTKITITGYVYDTECRPLTGVWLDFWQADGRGNYDNTGFRLRGHQFTDATGRYTLETVMPGGYTGRTAHIHVKVRAEGKPELTTQIFFPGNPRNTRDGIFDPSLVARKSEGDGMQFYFDFIIASH